MRLAFSLAIALGLSCSGCYLVHGIGGEPDAGSRRREVDAARPASRDAGPRPDAGFAYPDATVVLPPAVDGGPVADDEPEIEPGERPSDAPEAEDWRDPPPASSGACCEVGDVVPLDDPDRQASVPVVAWSGVRWGVAFADRPAPPSWEGPPIRTVFRHVDGTGTPAGALQVLDGFEVAPADLAWGNGRYGLLTQGVLRGDGPALLAVLDEVAAPRRVTSIVESNVNGTVERYPLIHGWAVATYFDDTGGSSGLSRLLLFDDSLARLPTEHDLGRTAYADWRSISIVTLKSRLAVVQATDAGILTRAYDGPALLEDERVRSTVWPGSFPEEGGERGAPPVERVASAVSATRLRDSVVVAFMNRSHLATFVVDPFGGGPPRGPLPIVPSLGYRNPGMGGEDVSGTVGICFPGGSDDADRIRFVVVGPDGEAVGEPVTVVSGLRYAAACDVAAAGPGEWFVVWWNAARSERRHSISGARVRLR